MSDIRLPSAIAPTLARQYGTISSEQALAGGMTHAQVQWRCSTGDWRRLYRGVFRPASAPATPESELMAACLATGGRASHQSAGWLWDLVTSPPGRPVVTVGDGRSPRRPGVVVHRSRCLGPAGRYRRIPCTDLGRTVVDLAGVLDPSALNDVVDRVLARSLGVDRLAAALRQPGGFHRPGAGALRAVLGRRGYLDGPPASVLERHVLRLLTGAGIWPLAREEAVVWEGGRYRLDLTLAPLLALEVDGYAYHRTPEDLARDHRRRRHLAALGWTVLVYTWLDVVHDGAQLVAEVTAALRRHHRLASAAAG